MENKDIIKIIDEKNLFYLTLDQMANKLSKKIGLSLDDTKFKVKELLENGDLMFDENHRLFLTCKRGYIKCKISANKKGYAFAEIIDNPNNVSDIFIPKNYLNGALDEDLVLVQINNRQEDGLADGEVISVLKHNTEYIVGEFVVNSSKCFVQPDDEKFPIVKINRADRMGAVNGDKVVARVIFDSNVAERRGVICECLGKAGTVSAEELSIIRSYKLRHEFSDEVMKETEKIKPTVDDNDKKGRVDFTKSRIITIDGEDSRDFDDAISVERRKDGGYIVGIHIADVTHYVTEGGAIDSEAFLRGNSAYFPDLVIPMLPEKLSNGICSLREGEDRLTLSVIAELDKDAKVLSSKIVEGVIRSCHRMTYTKIQAMLNGNEEVIENYKDIYEDVLIYQEISKKLKQLRRARGEIRMDIPEAKVYEKGNGEIDHIEKEIQDESHELIESLMILANEIVAEKFFSKKLPFVYRVHEKPEASKVTKLVDVFAGLGINAKIDADNPSCYDYQKLSELLEKDDRKYTLMKILLRSMMKACYSDKCLGHFGIASTFYCHFTSPIRRYPDLTIHRIIKASLKKTASKNIHLNYDALVGKVSTQASLTERRADEAERAVDDYKKALYMQQHLGEVYTGIISGVHDFGVFVELDNTIEGLIKFEYMPVDRYDYDEKSQTLVGGKHTFRLGDKIDVICVNANTRLRQIDFDIAERLNHASIEEILAMRNNSFGKKQHRKTTTKPKPTTSHKKVKYKKNDDRFSSRRREKSKTKKIKQSRMKVKF